MRTIGAFAKATNTDIQRLRSSRLFRQVPRSQAPENGDVGNWESHATGISGLAFCSHQTDDPFGGQPVGDGGIDHDVHGGPSGIGGGLEAFMN